MVQILNYVYSVIDCSRQKSFGYIGLKGEQVFTVPYEDISAVVSMMQTGFLPGSVIVEPTETNWLKHDEVVRNLMAEHTTIPVKFSSMLRTDRDLRMMLRRILPECRAELNRLRDKVEMGVKILAAEEALRREASKERGDIDRFRTDLLHARNLMLRGRRISIGEAVEKQLDSLRRDARLEASSEKVYYAKKLYDTFVKLAVEARANPLLASDMILNASFLLNKDSLKVLETKLSELKRLYSGFQFLPSGPWAPYNFTRIKYY